jgi:hypothetical protein
LNAVQAIAAAAVVLVIGLPVGPVAWQWFADTLDVVPVATMPDARCPMPDATIGVILVVTAGVAVVAAVPAGGSSDPIESRRRPPHR